MDLASSLEAKFGVKSSNKRKNLGSSGTTIGKSWGIIPSIQENTLPMRIQRDLPQIFGSYLKFKRQNLGYLSPAFLEAKFGALT